MNLLIPKEKLNDTPLNFVRRLGYAEHRDAHATAPSFTRRAARDFFPRYHLYYDERPDGLMLKLHLDQKKPSYEGSSAHSGDYDGSAVEREIARIKSLLGL